MAKNPHMESMLFHAGRCSLHEEIDEMIEVTPVKSFNSVRTYRIASSPFFTSDVSLNDVVAGKEGADGSLLFDRVANHGGHSTFTVLVEEESDRQKTHFDKLRKLGCVLTHRTFGEFDDLLYSIDVPPGSDFDAIWTVLSDGAWSNLFALEERHVVHSLSDTYQPPDNSQPVDPEDLERLTLILAALRDSDWNRFKRLSDEAFPNEESMREQFDDTKDRIDYARVDLQQTALAGGKSERSKMIQVSLPNRDPKGHPISMSVNAKGARSRRKYGVCVLMEEMVFE